MKNIKKLKFISLLFLLSSVFSCEKKAIPTECVIERTTYKDKNVLEERVYARKITNICLKDNLPLKLFKPFDIVSSKDGNYVYVVSKNINNKNTPIIEISDDSVNTHFFKSISDSPPNIIYKITKDKKISIIKNFDYLGCNINQIEKKSNGNLVILYNDNNNVYSFDENNYKIDLSNIDDSVHSSGIFEEENNLYLAYQNDLVNGFGKKFEFIKKYNSVDNIFSYFYMDEYTTYEPKIKDKNITPKFIHEYLSKSGNDPYPMISNITHLNKNTESGYSRKYSVYNETPFFGIKDLIKDENELKKVGTVYLIRKNSKGEIFGLDMDKNVIWKILPNEQKINLFAGTEKAGYKDGKGEEAQFNGLSELDFDENDNLYVADTGNNAIRKITPDGEVSTFYKEKE